VTTNFESGGFIVRKLQTLAVVAAVAGGSAILSGAAIAAAPSTLWVSSATVSTADSSCAKPGYNTIQSAISAAPAGATIEICAGRYTEQLQITRSVSLIANGAVTVALPSAPADSTTACDTAPGTGAYQPDQDGIVICGPATVSITGLTVDAAWPTGTCDDSLYGVLVAGNATLTLVNSSIVAAGAVPLNGCQGGVGLQVGMAWTTPVEVGHATLINDTISGYQKNGVTIDGAGSSATISETTVTGAGPTTMIAQNGIQVSNGALGTISGSTITGNECNYVTPSPGVSCGADSMADYQASGVLFYGAAAGSSVTGSSINANDIGVYNAEDSATAPSAPVVSISGDSLVNDRYEGVLLDQGWASISADVIRGGNVGVQALQYAGQSYGANGNMSADVITGESVAAVQVYSDHAASGDLPGVLNIQLCVLDGNAARVLDNSSNYKVNQFLDS
jgi:hypothetical protein